jgi:hypothetical protein
LWVFLFAGALALAQRRRLGPSIAAVAALLGGFAYYSKHPPKKKSPPPPVEIAEQEPPQSVDARKPVAAVKAMPSEKIPSNEFKESNLKKVSTISAAKNSGSKSDEAVVRFKIEDGLAVVDGDMVLGELNPGAPQTGYAAAPALRLWESRRIPYFIQPEVDRPERILEALENFSGTPIQFVPYTNEEDVLVFQNGASNCRSYMGKVGGKQPIWLSPACGATEITHELLHALGFIHEQNRSDRDSYIQVMMENIEEGAEINFEAFPSSLMTVSGLAPFDYHSLMLYPPGMFGKPGQGMTMISRNPQQVIAPSSSLSPSDTLRIQKAYGNR